MITNDTCVALVRKKGWAASIKGTVRRLLPMLNIPPQTWRCGNYISPRGLKALRGGGLCSPCLDNVLGPPRPMPMFDRAKYEQSINAALGRDRDGFQLDPEKDPPAPPGPRAAE